MTTAARRIAETPMAPYADIMRGMKPNDMLIVMNFLKEAMQEAALTQPSASDIIQAKFRHLAISDETRRLVQGLSLSEEEVQDERTRHILGY